MVMNACKYGSNSLGSESKQQVIFKSIYYKLINPTAIDYISIYLI